MAAIRTQCHQVFSPLPSSPHVAVVVLLSQDVVLVIAAVVVVVGKGQWNGSTGV